MIKSELILKIAEQNPHLYEQDAADIVNVILDTVADALAQGGRVELRGVGVFTAKRRGERGGSSQPLSTRSHRQRPHAPADTGCHASQADLVSHRARVRRRVRP